MKLLILLIFILCILSGLGVGLLFVLRPALAIEIQRRFYALINWKIEPISMKKELHNTRIMGLMLIILLLATLFFLLTRNPTLQ